MGHGSVKSGLNYIFLMVFTQYSFIYKNDFVLINKQYQSLTSFSQAKINPYTQEASQLPCYANFVKKQDGNRLFCCFEIKIFTRKKKINFIECSSSPGEKQTSSSLQNIEAPRVKIRIVLDHDVQVKIRIVFRILELSR